MTSLLPDDRHRQDKRALIAVAAQFFVNGAVFGSVSPRLPEIRDHVGLTAGQIGLLMSVAGAGGLVGSAFAGRSIERFGTRRVILIAATVVALALPLVGLASGPVVLAVGLMLMMTFDVPVDVAMNLQGSWLSSRRPVPVMNRLHGLWSLGTMGGGVVSAQMALLGVSVRNHLLVASGVLLVVLAFISRGLLPSDDDLTENAPVDSPADDGPVEGSPAVKPGVASDSHEPAGGQRPKTSSRSPRFGLLLFIVAGYAAITVEATSIEWAAFRFVDDLGQSTSVAAWAFVAVTGGMTVGRFAGDWAATRLGKDRLLDAAAVVTAVGLVLASMINDPVVGVIGFLSAGIGIAVFLPEVYDRAAKYPGRRGAGLGALTAGLRLAALTIPVLVGLVIDLSGSVGYAIAVSTLPAVVVFVLAVRGIAGTRAPES